MLLTKHFMINQRCCICLHLKLTCSSSTRLEKGSRSQWASLFRTTMRHSLRSNSLTMSAITISFIDHYEEEFEKKMERESDRIGIDFIAGLKCQKRSVVQWDRWWCSRVPIVVELRIWHLLFGLTVRLSWVWDSTTSLDEVQRHKI